MPKNRAMSSDPPPTGPATEITGMQRVGVWVLSTVIKIWARTVRVTIAPADRLAIGRNDQAVTLIVWHNRLFMTADITRRVRAGRPFHGLISASKDGAWLVAFYKSMKIGAIRGSSSWGAREAANAVIATAKAGHDIGITPDGPRGPRYEFKPGALIIARRAKTPLLLIGFQFSRVKELRSWDRFILPWPFSKMTVRCQQVMPSDLPKDRAGALDHLTAIMHDLNGTQPLQAD